MTVIAWIFLSLNFIGFSLVTYGLTTFQGREFAKERKAWTDERRELLNRIQRPEHLPVAARPEFVVPEPEPDEWNKVGRIVIDPKYGLDDD